MSHRKDLTYCCTLDIVILTKSDIDKVTLFHVEHLQGRENMTKNDYDMVANILAHCVEHSETDTERETVEWVTTNLVYAFRQSDIDGQSEPFDVTHFVRMARGGR